MNETNRHKQTPLHLAVAQGHFGLMYLLLEKGGDVNKQDEDGNTVFTYALLQRVTPVNPKGEKSQVKKVTKSCSHQLSFYV